MLATFTLSAKILTMAIFAIGVVMIGLAVFGIRTIYDAIIFLFQFWIIQGLFGAWLAHSFQNRHAKIQRTNATLEASYNRQISAIKSLHLKISRRIYGSRRYLDVIESEPNNIDAERALYRSIVQEWNEQSAVDQVFLLIDFKDSQFGLSLDRDYFPRFSSIDRKLRAQRILVQKGQNPDPSVSRAIRDELSHLNRISIDLMREALKVIKLNRDRLDSTLPITEYNIPDLTYSRLLNSLFQPPP
jgi:hypothetical protein